MVPYEVESSTEGRDTPESILDATLARLVCCDCGPLLFPTSQDGVIPNVNSDTVDV